DLRHTVQRGTTGTGDDEHALPAVDRGPANRPIVDRRTIARDDGVTLVALGARERLTLEHRGALHPAQQELTWRLLLGLAVDEDLHHGVALGRERDQAVALVVDGPAARECHGDSHIGVIEAVVAHDALRLAGAVGNAVDRRQVLVVTHQPSAGRRFLDVRGSLGGLHRALVRARVAGEHTVVQAGLASLGGGALALELLAG